MKPLRFRLSALLVFITAVAVFFGYSQWRRSYIRAECKWLAESGMEISLPDDAIDYLWQRLPTAQIRLIIGERNSTDDWSEEITRLHQLGVKRYITIAEAPKSEH